MIKWDIHPQSAVCLEQMNESTNATDEGVVAKIGVVMVLEMGRDKEMVEQTTTEIRLTRTIYGTKTTTKPINSVQEYSCPN